MSARRVLVTADAVGGVWQYALDLAAALPAHGYEPIVALLGPPPSDDARAKATTLPGLRLIETGLALDWLAPDAAAVRATARRVAELAAELDVALVQLNQPALAAEPMPVPTIAVMHSCVATWWAAVHGGALPADLAWQTRLVAEGLARADVVVAPSAAFAATVARTYALSQPPRVVRNGRTPIAHGEGAVRDFAMTAGRLWDEGKDLATLDRAAASLDVPVRAVGAVTSPQGGTARFAHLDAVGALDERALGAMLDERPVFVSASRYEPFGLAVLEAAQAGCALVLADIPTFRELWDGAAAFVAPGDADGFAAAIAALVAVPDARTDAGARARERAARYTVGAMVTDMAALYAAVLADAGARIAA